MILGYILIGLLVAIMFIVLLRLLDPFRSFSHWWILLIGAISFLLSYDLQWILLEVSNREFNIAAAEDETWIWIVSGIYAGFGLLLQMVLFLIFTTVFRARQNPVVFLQSMGAISLGSGLAALWLLRETYPIFWVGGLLIFILAGQILWGQMIAYGWMSLRMGKARHAGILIGLLGVIFSLIWLVAWFWHAPFSLFILGLGILYFLFLSMLPQTFNNAVNFSPKFRQSKGMDYSLISAYMIVSLFVVGAVILGFAHFRAVETMEMPFSGVYLWASMFVVGLTFFRWPRMRLVPQHWEKIRFQLIFTAWDGMVAPKVFGGLPHSAPHIMPLPADRSSQLRISGPKMNETYLDSLLGERVMVVPASRQNRKIPKAIGAKFVRKQFIGRDISVYRVEVEGEEAGRIRYLMPRYKRQKTKDDHYFMGLLVPKQNADLSPTFLKPSDFSLSGWVILYDEEDLAKRKKETQPQK